MASLFFAALVLGQCQGGTCTTKTSAVQPSYSYSYQSSYSYQGNAPVAYSEPKRRGLFKRLFRKP